MSRMIKFIKKRWYVIVGMVIVIGFIFYQRQTTLLRAKKEKSRFTVKKQTIKDELSLSGEIAADEHVILRFQSSGRLAWVGVKEGDYVKKYQGVASLDQREVQQNLKKYLNTYVNERWDLDQEKQDTQIKYTGGLSE